MITKFYHGTTPEAAAGIMTNGFDVDAKRAHDPGDFGWGTYFTTDWHRAREMGGPVLLEVEIEMDRLARIENPYFLHKLELIEPANEIEWLFFGLAFTADGMHMKTIHGDREAVAKQISEAFTERGFTGITTAYHGDETVIFDTDAIRSITWRR